MVGMGHSQLDDLGMGHSQLDDLISWILALLRNVAYIS